MKNLKGKNNPNYKDGRTLKKYFCQDCGIELSRKAYANKSLKCRHCAHKGKKISSKTRIKMSKNSSKYWLNKKLSKEIRLKMSKNHADVSGNKNPMYGKTEQNAPAWLGGISKLPYAFKFTMLLKESIRRRDNYICQKCKITQKNHYRKLDVHHIDYDKQNCKESNLITLCNRCNLKVNYNRDYWYAYFTYIIEEIL